MEELCESLDQTVLDIFQVLEDLYEKQASLEQALKDGFFSMARARYNMGVKRVTADQIVDAEMSAGRTVEVRTPDWSNSADSDDDKDEKRDVASAISEDTQDLFTLFQNNVTVKDKSHDKINKSDSVKESDSSGVRKRLTGAQASDTGKEWREVKDVIESLEREDKHPKPSNPIHLFGVLVPQALRSSQNRFEKAVRISVDIANDKHKLNALQKKLHRLRKKKSELLGSDGTAECTNNEL